MKVYIAGQITNNENYIDQFKECEEFLKSKGHAVINPVKNLGFTYKEYIDMGLTELSKCDTICLLDGYENSNGAMLELMYAETVGIRVMHYSQIIECYKKIDE